MKRLLTFAALVTWIGCVLCGLGQSGSVQAAEADKKEGASSTPVPPNKRLYLSSLTIIRYNPIGLETQNRLMFSRRLRDSESLLFRDTYLAAGLMLKLNPAYLKVGPLIDFQPIALLHIRAGYEFVKYFGSFGYLQSFDDATEDYSDAVREAGTGYGSSGHHILFEPTLQAKVGRIALRSKTAIEYWNVGVTNTEGTPEDYTFYDGTLDTLVPANGLVLANDSDLLFLAGPRLTVGLRYSGVYPRYGAEDFDGGAVPEGFEAPSHHRLGPLLAYTFNPRDYSSFNKPTLLLITGFYLNHPNRTLGVPYVLLGFSFSSDLLKR